MTHDSVGVRATIEEDGSLLSVTLDRPPGNVIDTAVIEALREAVADAGQRGVRTILFAGAGGHFSYGVSVAEHRAAEVRGMLAAFHALFRDLARSGRVLLAAVDGCCLGGGLELTAFCHRAFASPGARLGCPESTLGVFAPIASLILPCRVGQPAADDLLLSGRILAAGEALALRLVDALAQDPARAAVDWHRTHVLPKSAATLPFAVQAARWQLQDALERTLPALESLYLDGLMATRDAAEGIQAFLDKRPPRWTHS